MRVFKTAVSREGNRVQDHSTLRTLNPVYFLCLSLGREVFVNNPDASLTCHLDSQFRLSNCIHSC